MYVVSSLKSEFSNRDEVTEVPYIFWPFGPLFVSVKQESKKKNITTS